MASVVREPDTRNVRKYGVDERGFFEALLVSRLYMYSLFRQVFGTAPTATMLSELCSHHAQACFEYHAQMCCNIDMDATSSTAYGSGAMDGLDAVRKAYEYDGRGFIESETSHYTRLFIGPNALPVPPWESVQAGGERVLLDACTLEVRRCYAREGYLPAGYPRVADDHIAIELDFMAKLSQSVLDALQSDCDDELARLLRAQKEFLSKHLWGFAEKLASGLEGVDEGLLYPSCAKALSGYLCADSIVLSEMLDAMSGRGSDPCSSDTVDGSESVSI